MSSSSSCMELYQINQLLEPFSRCGPITVKFAPKSGSASPETPEICGDEAAGAALDKEREASLSQDKEAILKLLTDDLWSNDKKAIPSSLAKLSNYCVDSKDRSLVNKQYILENDGVGLITQVMKMNQTDIDILAWAAAALANLIDGFDGACDKVQRLGGAQIVIQTMKAHPDQGLVQSTGCCFIGNFIWKNKDRMKLSVELDGIPTILSAMDKCPEDLHLQKCASWVLYSLCQESEYVSLVAKDGGLGLVAKSLEKHRDDPDIKLQSKFVINALHEYLQK